MEPVFFLFAFGIVLIIGFAIFSAMAAAKRRQNLIALASAHHLTFSEGKDRTLEQRFPEFPCLREGSDRYGENILTGDWRGRRMTAFDYHYETESTNSKGQRETTSHYFSAVILSSPVPLKPLLIRREHLGDKLKAFFGFDDIDFESAEFSRRFFVASTDRKWAYDVLHQRTIEYLMTAPEFSVQFGPDCAMAWRKTIFTADEFGVAADHLRNILELLPEWLVRQQQGA
jgi:hypothetical protein